MNPDKKPPAGYPPDQAKPAKQLAQTSATYGAPFRGNVSDIIAGMRGGISAQIAPEIAARLDISQDKLFETLRLPKSTMKARLGKAQLLSPVEQDRMYRADKVWGRALAVLEDPTAAANWIKRDNRALGGEAPLAMLDTEAGYELVLDTLARIEYGVIS